jgi:hypothetical protein
MRTHRFGRKIKLPATTCESNLKLWATCSWSRQLSLDVKLQNLANYTASSPTLA